MEEKERYKLESYNEAFCQIHDTESDEWYLRKDLVKDLLNQQDQKIKELEVKLAERTKQLKIALKDFNDIQQENDKLAQQLAEEQNKVVQKIRKKFPMPKDEIPDETTYSLNEFLDQIERVTDD